jgi:asparagine synthase (glutamine-hydrolysing)
MAHRGPDDEQVASDGPVTLGARRLAVIDPSAAGRQPMRSADGRYAIVYDGEIYNYAELAQRLQARGVALRGRSDTEVLLETYAAEGRDALRRLRGMFAFAIWDGRTGELFCARDPFGAKPLYYMLAEGGTQFRFASERKALLGPGEVPVIDPDALRRYLSFQYVPAPSTMTPPAVCLPAGCSLLVRPGAPLERPTRYWRPMLRPAKSPSPETPERVLAALRGSVAAHLRSDVPVGAFLSGGVDSAAICAIAAETNPGMLTFTAGFARPGYSEIEEAQETAAALGLRNVSYVITPQEFAARLPRIIWQLDDPLADAAAVGLWFVAREARRHVKVVLSGEGADELFGGYGVYYQPGVVRAATKLPGSGRSLAQAMAHRIPPGQRGKGLLERIATPLRTRYIGNANIFVKDEVDALTRYGDGTVFDVTGPVFDQAQAAGLDDVATMQLVDINTWLPGDILVKADRGSMAHGLELRMPFLDREVMSVAARLARAEKTAAGTTKFVLREAVGPLLPRDAAERRKLGFPVPLGPWLRGELSGYAEQVINEARTEEWLDRREVLDVLRRFRAGDPDIRWRQVWTLLVFSLWHQVYLEQAYDEQYLRGGDPLLAAFCRCGREQAAVHELLADLAAAAVQAGHDRSDRGAHDLRDFPVRVALDVGEVDRGPELVRQAPQRAQQVGVGHVVQGLGLRGGNRRGEPVGGHLPFLQVAAERLLRLAAPLAVDVDERGGEDAVEPSPQVGSGTELVEGGVRLGRRLLDQVFGVGRVARHPQRRGVKLAELRHDLALKPGATVVVFDRAHPWLRGLVVSLLTHIDVRNGSDGPMCDLDHLKICRVVANSLNLP